MTQSGSGLTVVKDTMAPQLDALVEHLTVVQEYRAASFFSEIASALERVAEEADLIEVFLALSTTAFQGFIFDPQAAVAVDEVLAYAEQVSQTYMADDSRPH
ncbi:MAG: hypothetical protein AAGI24_16105 [Pseudomonadota bacterium]